jgi:two-component system cell cycle response regulator DivK
MLTSSAQKKILIVEDNALNLKLLTDILEYHGYFVFSTSLGEAALDLAEQHRPDLILMDIQLPDISGTEATRRLKAYEQTRLIPIIAVTAFAMSGDREGILLSGCDEYLAKPFKIADLLELVTRYTQ